MTFILRPCRHQVGGLLQAAKKAKVSEATLPPSNCPTLVTVEDLQLAISVHRGLRSSAEGFGSRSTGGRIPLLGLMDMFSHRLQTAEQQAHFRQLVKQFKVTKQEQEAWVQLK